MLTLRELDQVICGASVCVFQLLLFPVCISQPLLLCDLRLVIMKQSETVGKAASQEDKDMMRQRHPSNNPENPSLFPWQIHSKPTTVYLNRNGLNKSVLCHCVFLLCVCVCVCVCVCFFVCEPPLTHLCVPFIHL